MIPSRTWMSLSRASPSRRGIGSAPPNARAARQSCPPCSTRQWAEEWRTKTECRVLRCLTDECSSRGWARRSQPAHQIESIWRHGNAGSPTASVGSLRSSPSHFNSTSISVGAFSSIAAAAWSQSSMHALRAAPSTAVSLQRVRAYSFNLRIQNSPTKRYYSRTDIRAK